MNTPTPSVTSRREFLKNTGRVAATGAMIGAAVPHVHAAEDNTIRLALIGCGGRGTGAAGNALTAPGGPVKLVAMADLFPGHLAASHASLCREFGKGVDVPPERRFLGFDAYRQAIDCLRPGDVAILTTHSAFRATHLEYAVEKGVNVFMEKSFAPDPGGTRRILKAGEAAEKKNLKLAAGLMCRHSAARQAFIQKVRDGVLGRIGLIRAYRMGGNCALAPRPPADNELLWQIRRAYYFLWVSSGMFIEMTIHQIDECCWLKDAWPVAAHGFGGRIPDSTDCSPNLDTYSIEYTFADGSTALVGARYITGCHEEFNTYVHGSKCAGQFSGDDHMPMTHIYKDHRLGRDNIAWKPAREKVSPWQAEWNELLDAIRHDRPYNESRRAAYTNLAALMGRAAVHTGKIVTWEDALASKFQFCPNVSALTEHSPAPVRADTRGRYPAPIPGTWKEI
jgi:predicted dehydrogenase